MTLFRKGQSGNPAGRPKGAPTLVPSIKRLLEQPGEDGRTGKDRLARALLERAYAGEIEAIKVVLDRVDGKLTTPVDVDHAGGLTVQVAFVDETPERA